GAEYLVVEQEMPAPGAGVPEIVLRDRVTKRIARLEQAGHCEGLTVCRLGVRYRRHHRTGIDRLRYRAARRPGAPLTTLTSPYPNDFFTQAADVRRLRHLCPTRRSSDLGAEYLVVEKEMPAPGSAVPEIVLRDRITKRIARREQARYRKALIVA